MASEKQPDDYITQTVLSGSMYDRVRCQRFAFVRQPVSRTLTLLSIGLGLVALSLPMYGLYPASVETYLPATDPAVAAPNVLLLGVFGAGMEVLSALVLFAAGMFRIYGAPLTEAQAHQIIDAEDFARYVGLGTGGLATLITVALFSLGLGGGETIGAYIASVGRNPFVDSGIGLSVQTVAVTAFAASVLAFVAGRYLSTRLGPDVQ